jgi:hypothetical protein
MASSNPNKLDWNHCDKNLVNGAPMPRSQKTLRAWQFSRPKFCFLFLHFTFVAFASQK